MTTPTSRPSGCPWETLADGGVSIIGYGEGFQVIASEICGKDKEQAQANALLDREFATRKEP